MAGYIEQANQFLKQAEEGLNKGDIRQAGEKYLRCSNSNS